jgi:predicted amidophosphoribosyltransferase
MHLAVGIYDTDREEGFPLGTTGLSVDAEGAVHAAREGSSVQRFIVDDAIEVAPRHVCPACWGEWDDKVEYPDCPECASALGHDIWLLLDSDVCPKCEEGTVTRAQPKCSACGFEVNPHHVRWG